MYLREVRLISALILVVSIVAWVTLLFGPARATFHSHDHTYFSGIASGVSQDYPVPPASIVSQARHAVAHMVGWALMLVAMMSPTLIAPISHIVERSFKRRRARSVMLFVIGYAVIWMAAGIALLASVRMVNLLMPQSYLPAVGVGIVAVMWQWSPFKQRCLNRNHNHRALAAFGITADMDVLQFGITHGVWCVGSCWALMLLPMMLSYGHFVAMAVVTFVMISERLEQPKPLRWHLRPRGRLIRLVAVQTQIQLQRALPRKL